MPRCCSRPVSARGLARTAVAAAERQHAAVWCLDPRRCAQPLGPCGLGPAHRSRFAVHVCTSGERDRPGHGAHELSRHRRAVDAARHALHKREPRGAADRPAAATVDLHAEVAVPRRASSDRQTPLGMCIEFASAQRGRQRRCERDSGALRAARCRFRRRRGQRRVVTPIARHDPVEQPRLGSCKGRIGRCPADLAVGADEALDDRTGLSRTSWGLVGRRRAAAAQGHARGEPPQCDS